MSTFDASQNQFNQYHFTVVEMDLPIVTGAASLTTAIELAEPQWYWKLNEETGIVATDTMLNGNLEYESAASSAGYNIIPSSADGLGSAKNIRGDVTFQIYDPIPAAINPAAINPTDMVAWWTLDAADVAAEVLADVSTNGADNILDLSNWTSGRGTQSGQVGDSFSTAGNKYCKAVSAGVDWSATQTDLTDSIWIKTSTALTSQYIFQALRVSGSFSGYRIRIAADDNIYFEMFTGSSTTQVRTDTTGIAFTASTGDWIHVCATYNSTTEIQSLYINGVLVDSISNTSGLVYNLNPYVRLGAYYATSPNVHQVFFIGNLDNYKHFNRAISASEVLAMYTADGGL